MLRESETYGVYPKSVGSFHRRQCALGLAGVHTKDYGCEAVPHLSEGVSAFDALEENVQHRVQALLIWLGKHILRQRASIIPGSPSQRNFEQLETV